MAIGAEDLAAIEAVLAEAPVGSAVMAELRQKFPHLKWSKCETSDVLEEPFRTFPGFDLHLMDATNHCPVVVADPAAANGAIVATRG